MGVYFSVSSLIIIGMLSYIFFSKEKLDNFETKIYGKMLIVTIIGLLLEIITCIVYENGIDLNNKNVLMIDDIIAYGGSLYYSAKELNKCNVNK